MGLLLAGLGAHNLYQGLNRGHISDFIICVIQLFLCGYYFFEWFRYRSGYFTLAFDQGVFEIRKSGVVIQAASISDLKIDQDGRGYTVTCGDDRRFRLLRKDMDAELQGILDSVKAERNEK